MFMNRRDDCSSVAAHTFNDAPSMCKCGTLNQLRVETKRANNQTRREGMMYRFRAGIHRQRSNRSVAWALNKLLNRVLRHEAATSPAGRSATDGCAVGRPPHGAGSGKRSVVPVRAPGISFQPANAA